MKNVILYSFICAAAAPLLADPLLLWPSDLCEAKSHTDSSISTDPQNVLFVKTGTRYTWPGATIAFKSGTRDLATYGPLNITVSNTCDHPLNISLSVKNSPQKERSPGGSVTVNPGETGVITANLRQSPWMLDKPLELVGMRGYPASLEGGTFNVRKTAELHVFLNNPSEPGSFAVLRAEAVEKPLNLMASDTFMPFVDRFGQFVHADWPGKVHSDEELQKAKADEASWLAENAAGPAADRDAWGGWTHGPQLKATGHFRTEKVNGKWWLVDPDGRLFFSHGVDCVRPGSETGVEFRTNYFAWLPDAGTPAAKFYGRASWAPHGFYKDKKSYRTFDYARANLLQKYGTDWETIFAELAHRRIRAWGLNTVANWSDSKVYLQRRTAYTVCLNTKGPRIEGSDGWWGKFPDPFAPAFGDGIRQRALEQQKAGTTTDPWCIGYFVDNELSWGKDDRSLAWSALLSPADQPVKVAFKAWLADKYASPEELNKAWGTAYASWDAFLTSTNKPAEKQCGADMEAFHTQIAEQYSRVRRDAVKAAAPDKLYLGCRIAWGAPSVYRAAAKYCDVVSVNTYQKRMTKDLPEGSEDKPMINGEFHFGALDRGLFHTGLVATRDQNDRAACYTDFVNSCLDHPRFVGTHWFQWRDQALTGRGDGENYQIGFLTITDQPYPELVAASRAVGAAMYERRFGKR
nr:beta-agarase [uncultured bacterium]